MMRMHIRRPSELLPATPAGASRLAQQTSSSGHLGFSLSSVPRYSGQPVQRVSDGLPAGLRAGAESLSGIDMADVRVRRNSATPAKVGAHAFAAGSEIHLAPGQDRYLAHEAWHVVQQKQGRVRPTMRESGIPINDDIELEREADSMGAKASAVGTAQIRAGGVD